MARKPANAVLSEVLMGWSTVALRSAKCWSSKNIGIGFPSVFSVATLSTRIVWCDVGLDGSGSGACGHLGGPRHCLCVDIFPDVRHFAVSNGNGEDPMILKPPVRGFYLPRSEADDQNSVSLGYELWSG